MRIAGIEVGGAGESRTRPDGNQGEGFSEDSRLFRLCKERQRDFGKVPTFFFLRKT
jgi:hypothetical protein